MLVNPLVYVSEGMRGAVTPGLPHTNIVAVMVALAVLTAFFWYFGLRSFMKRALS